MQTLKNNYTMRVGIGHSRSELNAFDRALISAGVSDYNLITISSILPPRSMYQDDIALPKGSLLPTAAASIFSEGQSDTIAAAVAVGIPVDEDDMGVIMRYSNFTNKDNAEAVVRSFAKQAMEDRGIFIKKIKSIAIECRTTTSEIYCAFAAVSLW